MKRIIKIIFIGIVSGCAIGYLLLCGAVVTFPEWFFYNPSQENSDLAKAHADELPFQTVEYQAKDKTKLLAWFIPSEDNKKTIVFMHGNAQNVEAFYPKMKIFAEQGYGILMPEYRGFGGVSGKITQQNLEQDALAAVDFLTNLGYSQKNIYLYGMSLGTYMALHTAVQRQNNGNFAGIILEVPFDSLLNVAKKRAPILPTDIIVRDQYDNTKIIQQIQSPILIMAAKLDKVVPVELAKNLYQIAPEPKTIKIYEKAHHSNLQHFRNDLDILKWMETHEKNI